MTTMQLSWISTSKLIDIAERRFKNAYVKAQAVAKASLQVEPTLAITRSFLTGVPLEDYRVTDEVVSVTKTLQNAIGDFHQDVLSNAHGWKNMGTSGGKLDIQSKEPIALARNRLVVAEVKMRYNTIKASDEKNTYDAIKDAVAILGGPRNVVGYLIQVVPKNKESYDKPWVPSGRTPLDYVRVVDGVTGYHLVTGDPNALFDLIDILPDVLNAAIQRLTLNTVTPQRSQIEKKIISQLISNSLPGSSAWV